VSSVSVSGKELISTLTEIPAVVNVETAAIWV
jgi:hypothetical protein